MTETKKLYAAMAKAFSAIEGASKDKANPQFKGIKYADLSSVVAAIKPALIANELWFAQINHEQSGGVCIETVLFHSSGEQMSFGKLFVPVSKNDAQGYGSALTYARRYSLLTAFGVCPDDDDGNAAVKARPAQDKYQEPKIDLITDEQRGDLISLTEGYGINVIDVCKFYKIKDYREIPADEFENVKMQLQKQFDKKRIKEGEA